MFLQTGKEFSPLVFSFLSSEKIEEGKNHGTEKKKNANLHTSKIRYQ